MYRYYFFIITTCIKYPTVKWNNFITTSAFLSAQLGIGLSVGWFLSILICLSEIS